MHIKKEYLDKQIIEDICNSHDLDTLNERYNIAAHDAKDALFQAIDAFAVGGNTAIANKLLTQYYDKLEVYTKMLASIAAGVGLRDFEKYDASEEAIDKESIH